MGTLKTEAVVRGATQLSAQIVHEVNSNLPQPLRGGVEFTFLDQSRERHRCGRN